MISSTCKHNKYILLCSLITQKDFFYAKGPQLSILGVWWVPVAQNQCLQRPLFLQLVACNKCNRLHVPISSAIAQLRSTKMFSLCAATGCTKYFHLSLRLFVQNFLCARSSALMQCQAAGKAHTSCFVGGSLNQNWLAVWFLGLGFLLSRTSGPPHFCLGLYCRLSLSKLKIYFSPSIKGRM